MIRLIVSVILINSCLGITRYNFNVCRLAYCTTQESTCVGSVGDCMQAFARTRICFNGCNDNETFNNCWKQCKQTTVSDSSYVQVSKCYEDMCYLGSWRMAAVLAMALMLLALV